MKITAVGDVALQRRIPGAYEGFQEIQSFIGQGDVRFFNLETTVNKNCFGAFFSGGTWLRTDPEVLASFRSFGFNVTTTANNHATDFAYDGLLQTMENVQKEGYIFSGTGRNLSEAASPAYLDLPQGRVALISVTDSFSPGAMAGEQSRRLPGRPGVNGLRIKQTVIVRPEELAQLRTIADSTRINAYNDIIRAEGYLPPLAEGDFDFGDMHFCTGDTPGFRYEVQNEDLRRLEKSIYEASLTADMILVSIHSHKTVGDSKETVPDYLADLCRLCIDRGAHAVIGHGPHLLRGIEIYKERPIFYSLGDFLLQLESGPYAPEDFFAKWGLTSESTMHELFRIRSRDFTVGLQRDRKMLETVIPGMQFENGKLKEIEILPVILGGGPLRGLEGLPKVAENTEILERLAELSVPFGTEITIRNGRGYIKI
ncbi:MAG: CapA family protein [Ruminococcaceae bacterium]|nr:CapA family protein [Oscillospiraceae bacterium]